MTDYQETHDPARKPEPPMSGAEFQRNVHDEVDSWTIQMMASAERLGFKVEYEWLRSWLGDAMDAARKGTPKPVVDG
jgi:hypothetical protein